MVETEPDGREDGRAVISDIKSVGSSNSRFIKGDFPTGDEYSEEEKMAFFKGRKYAVVSIEIKAKSSNVPFTILVDGFTLHLEHGIEKDNVEVITKKLQNIIPQISVLINRWTEEMNK